MIEVKVYIPKHPKMYRRTVEKLGIGPSYKNLEDYPDIFYYDLEKLEKGEKYLDKDLTKFFIGSAMYIRYNNKILIGLGVNGLGFLEDVMYAIADFFHSGYEPIDKILGIDYLRISIKKKGEDAEILVYEEGTNRHIYNGSAPKGVLFQGVLDAASAYYNSLHKLNILNNDERKEMIDNINKFRKLIK
ncbi:hypothetical protein [Chengkuizengella marina]|uniref:Uncharacterized protein n=1 Tax=Chengkuizengella marina TaxID=2507566 RepID=A0A6N9Q315_9BACL|nr:hypothetical protein [Chengkuizengella marina]NBI29176.1 hypothetical protein [Chengkuizengella marina]